MNLKTPLPEIFTTPYTPGSVLQRPGWPPIYLNPSLDAIGAQLIACPKPIWCPRPEGTDLHASLLCRKLYNLLGPRIIFDPVLKTELLKTPEPPLPHHLIFSSPAGIRAFQAQSWTRGAWLFLPVWCVGHGTASALKEHKGKICFPEKEEGLNQFNINNFLGPILQITGEITRRDFSLSFPDQVRRLVLYRMLPCDNRASKILDFSAILCFSRQTLHQLIALSRESMVGHETGQGRSSN